MSSLVGFRILSNQSNVLEVEVRIVHPDEHHINDELNFAFQIVIEQFNNIELGYIYNSAWQNYPFTEEESKALITDELREELQPMLELCYGKDITITKQEYEQIQNSGTWQYKGKKVSSLGIEHETRHHLTFEPEYDAFCEAVEDYIEKVEVVGHANYPHWFDRVEAWLEYQKTWDFPEEAHTAHEGEPDPTYVLKITFKKPQVLAHMVEGSSWESAAFTFEGYYASNYEPSYVPQRKLILEPAELNPVPTIEELQQWWQGLSDAWKRILQVNLYIQQRQLFTSMAQQVVGMHTLAYFENNYKEAAFEVPDAQDLENIVKMKALFASAAELDTLEPIGMLKGLQLVELESNYFDNITPLGGLKDLQYLNLYSCNEIALGQETLGDLKALKYLYFDPQNQADIDAVVQLPHLRELHFMADFEVDATGFDKMPQLKKVSGYSYQLTQDSLSVLKALHQKELDIQWELGENGEMLSFD